VSSLRDLLRGVPQDARFHPEGDVWTHTRLVRRARDEAVNLIRSSAMPATPTPRERNLLRAAAWCHDLGKAGVTRVVGTTIVAPGHETARRFNEVCRQLGPAWHRVWRSASFEDRKDFVYLVTRHMDVSDRQGLSGRVARHLVGGSVALRRRARLLVVFMMMDRLGCASPTRVEDARLVLAAAERLVV
jgi:hypothetical protein